MKKRIIYETTSLYRDAFRVTGFEFGSGKKSVCIVGNTRGNEFQQMYVCARLVNKLRDMEAQGRINEGHSILVIPSMNPYSVNSKKRFWPTDNTDINRMFPGYSLGETTQRIAGGVFEEIKDYDIGIQFTSFYMPGDFLPHVRMMKTGFEDVEMAKEFGMPYVVVRNVRPFDTATLNYNWQIWETKAFSMYTASTEKIDKDSAKDAVYSILRFLAKRGVVTHESRTKVPESIVVVDTDMKSVRTHTAGIFEPMVKVGAHVSKEQILARVINPLDGEIEEELRAPVNGKVFFVHNEPLTYADTAVIKIVVKE